MRDGNDPESGCKVLCSCFYVCFPPLQRAGTCDSFYCHTVLGALTASWDPSEIPNVNLMIWCCANDRHARWRWQPYSSIYMIFLTPLTPSSVLRSCYLKVRVMFNLWRQCALLEVTAVNLNNNGSSQLIYMFCSLCKKKILPLFKMKFALRQQFRTVEELYCVSPASQDKTLHQSFNYVNRGRAAQRAQVTNYYDLSLSRQRPRKHSFKQTNHITVEIFVTCSVHEFEA